MASSSERFKEDASVQPNDYNDLRNALQQNNFEKAKAIVDFGEVELTPLMLGSLLEEIKAFEQGLRKDFIASFMRLTSHDHICTFIETALEGSDEEERRATMVAEHCPHLLIGVPGKQSLMDIAASKGKIWIIRKCLNFFSRNGNQEVLSDRIDFGNLTLPSTTLAKAAHGGHLEVVKMLVNFDKELLDHGYPLNAAVTQGHLEVVEFLLTTKAELVRQVPPGVNEYSWLFEQRNKEVPDQVLAAIDQLLIAQIVRVRYQSESPAVIKKYLTKPQAREICLDLTIFAQPTHRFKPMVDRLVQDNPKVDLRFHPTLVYVEFPHVNASLDNTEPEAIGQDAAKILQWLQKTKSVKEILRLCVPSSSPRSEREDVIRKGLLGISVDVLDWRVLDLSLDVILCNASKNLEELYLYGSGNLGVLQQWCGPEGVTMLPNLKRLHIKIVKDNISEEYGNKCIEMLKHRLPARLKYRPAPRPCAEFDIEASSWENIKSLPTSRGAQEPLAETGLTTMKLEHFLRFYKEYHSGKYVPIKVAIIDNGVDITLPSLWNTIIDGVSLVDNYQGREKHWWLATDPHGTHMASFIHQLDPYSQFYIAKVCDGTAGMQPDDVAEAISWSVTQKVDIISMSFTMTEKSPNLTEAVASAKSNDIVIIASKGDRGNNQDIVYPADYDEVISISSLTHFGKQAGSTEPNASYFCLGEDVVIPAESSYLEPQGRASGSSVATAIAAGVAALILSCSRLADKTATKERIKIVEDYLHRMTADSREPARRVQPSLIFRDKRMDVSSGVKWLQKHFEDDDD